MPSKLLRGAKGEERKALEERLVHNKDVLDLIAELVKEKLTESVVAMRKAETYDSSAWPYKQASRLGEQRAYAHVLDLVTLDREDTHD